MTKKKITEFKPLERNPNAHTERGYEMLERSISDVGYTAPMVASSDGVILDGNARYEKSGVLLGDDVIVIESDGTKPIVHVRTDIKADSEQARKIVYLANRVAEVDLQWDAAQLLADLDAGVDLSGLWTDGELNILLNQIEGDAWDSAFGGLPDEDRAPFQQMTFTLHDSQVEIVKEALQKAIWGGLPPSDNENSNGNALAYLCEVFLGKR